MPIKAKTTDVWVCDNCGKGVEHNDVGLPNPDWVYVQSGEIEIDTSGLVTIVDACFCSDNCLREYVLLGHKK